MPSAMLCAHRTISTPPDPPVIVIHALQHTQPEEQPTPLPGVDPIPSLFMETQVDLFDWNGDGWIDHLDTHTQAATGAWKVRLGGAEFKRPLRDAVDVPLRERVGRVGPGEDAEEADLDPHVPLDDIGLEVVRRPTHAGSSSRSAALAFAEQGEGGRIINTSSIAGLKGNFGQSNYAAAKAGIYALTRVHSMELARDGVTVNAVAPIAKTAMTQDMDSVEDDLLPEHVSPMVVFLASEESEGITGRIFTSTP